MAGKVALAQTSLQEGRRPVWLWIDPSRRCNIQCRLCYTLDGQGEAYLTPKMLESILAAIAESRTAAPRELTFNWRGEPLMNKDFETLLAILRDRGPDCPRQFHSNAMLFSRRRAAAIAANAGEMRIFLSIDGGTPESHDANRGAGTFSRALRGARELLRAREVNPALQVILYQLDLGVPVEDYDAEFLALAEACDDWQRVSPVVEGGEEGAAAKPSLVSLAALNKNARGSEPRTAPVSTNHLRSCFWAGNSLNIAPDGTCSICILSSRDDGILGNVLRDGVDELLERAWLWRSRLDTDGRGGVAHCSGCRKCEGQARPKRTTDLAMGESR
jgi:sulfatase maturation enzyme AslB (radical SAM superfamily)